MNSLNLSWLDVEKAVEIIVNRIGDKKYDYVIGIANGGLIPATLIAKKLKIKTLSVGLSSYQDKLQLKNVSVWSNLNHIAANEYYGTCLVVDDISDTGKTFKFLKDYYVMNGDIDCDSAALVVKPKTAFIPDFYAMSIDSEVWVKFPWE